MKYNLVCSGSLEVIAEAVGEIPFALVDTQSCALNWLLVIP